MCCFRPPSRECCLLLLLCSLLLLGIFLLLVGIFGLFFVPGLVTEGVKQKTHLSRGENGEDNLVLKMFRNPPYEINMKIWTISVQNADAVVKKGQIPEVVEKGPYTYSVQMHKTNVTFAADGNRLFYRNRRIYSFSRALSCAKCELADQVTVPNILFQKVVDIAWGKKWWERKSIEAALWYYNEGPFMELSVDELLFGGYEDGMVKMLRKLCREFPNICKDLDMPERMGLFYGVNGTDDGLYEIDTGIGNAGELGKLYSFNEMEGRLNESFWYGQGARMINGTDAELYGPDISDGRNLQIFLGQLCRSFELEKRGLAVDSDIPSFRYAFLDSALDAEVQREQGFCNPNSPDYFHNESIQQEGCAPSGLLDMSSCLPHNPRLFWSNSHFRNAPEGIRLPGMAAPSDDDLSYFDIEPLTASVVGVRQKSQLNVGMLRGDLGMTQKMRDLIVPIILVEETAKMDEGTKRELQMVYSIFAYSFNIGLGMVVAGLLLILAAIGSIILLKIPKKPEEFVRPKDEIVPPGQNGENEPNIESTEEIYARI